MRLISYLSTAFQAAPEANPRFDETVPKALHGFTTLLYQRSVFGRGCIPGEERPRSPHPGVLDPQIPRLKVTQCVT
jgi:hypothetical protein